jgi:hypothetical protein
MSESEKWSFVLKSFSKKLGQLFTVNLTNQSIEAVNTNNNKRLMQRYSLISQL